MDFEFLYGAKVPSIQQKGDGLRIGLVNPAFGPAVECWALPDGHYVKRGNFHLIKSGEYVVGAASVSVRPETLAATTDSLYRQLLNDLPPHSLCRIWHFVPNINEASNNRLENYQAFCLGRATAFERCAGEARHLRMPAASAVGTAGEHLGLVFLAAKPLTRHFENPRQTPAYHYPQKYGHHAGEPGNRRRPNSGPAHRQAARAGVLTACG